MTDQIDALIGRVIDREGRTFTNDSTDAGGPTKFGITQATLAQYFGHPVTAQDVAAMTEEQARTVYRKMFFPEGYNAIPDSHVLEFLFDYGVNSGVGQAARSLQTILKREGIYTGPIDGDFGPMSAAAVAKVKNWPALFYALKCERYELLLRYVGANPSQTKYAIGWSNRLDTLEYTAQ